MNKITKGLYKLGFQLKKHSPEILFGIGVVGVISAPILSAIGTMKAQDRIEEYYEQVPEEDRSKKELVKIVAPCYIPTVLTTAVTLGVFTKEKKVMGARIASAISAMELERSRRLITEQKVKEKFGAAKAEDIRAATDEELHKQFRKDKPEIIDESEVIKTGLGDLLIWDPETRLYFRASIDAVMSAKNKVNERLNGGEVFISVNEYLSLLNLPWLGLGENQGWMICDEPMEIIYTMTRYHGEEMMVLGYETYPYKLASKYIV